MDFDSDIEIHLTKIRRTGEIDPAGEQFHETHEKAQIFVDAFNQMVQNSPHHNFLRAEMNGHDVVQVRDLAKASRCELIGFNVEYYVFR